MKRVRFAPSPTGSLHVGNALSAVANRGLGDWMLLRIDDTDPQRNVPGGEEEIIHDLEWLGLVWEDGPVRQSERQDRYREAGAELGERFEGTTLLRADGNGTYHLARDLNEARAYAQAILTPPKPTKGDAPETLERFRELVERGNGTLDARSLVRELKAVGGNLKALRLALTGQERGPELWAVIAALPRDEALRRIDAVL